MSGKARAASIVLAEDDDDEYLLTKTAMEEARLPATSMWVKDGEELMDYLLRRGSFQNLGDEFPPSLVLLDINMPRKNGLEALREIRLHPVFRSIPVVIFTNYASEAQVRSAYGLGSNSVIKKPVSYADLVSTFKIFSQYWFHAVELPAL